MPERANDKATARSRFVNNRLTLGNHALHRASSAITQELLKTPELRVSESHPTLSVCAYVSFGTEPDTSELIDTLYSRGTRVLLPVVLADADLDWAVFDGRLAQGRFGMREPAGERLGVEAIQHADVVIVPALAVSDSGQRLGRGGGAYDRALARLARGAAPTQPSTPRLRPWVCALVYDHELNVEIPVEPHDQSVHAACAPGGLVRFVRPDNASGRSGWIS
jgi:5-formyltetrahydrofolate cyclo-ligase